METVSPSSFRPAQLEFAVDSDVVLSTFFFLLLADCDMLADADDLGRARAPASEEIRRRAATERGFVVFPFHRASHRVTVLTSSLSSPTVREPSSMEAGAQLSACTSSFPSFLSSSPVILTLRPFILLLQRRPLRRPSTRLCSTRRRRRSRRRARSSSECLDRQGIQARGRRVGARSSKHGRRVAVGDQVGRVGDELRDSSVGG